MMRAGGWHTGRERLLAGLVFGALSAGALTACPDRSASRAVPRTVEERAPRRETLPVPAATSAPDGAPPSVAEGAAAEEQRESPATDSPWHSHAACLRSLRQRRAEAAPAGGGDEPAAEQVGERTARRAARIGTWNVRWYPDGRPGKKAATPGTDIPWLACAIATLDVDVLALQEIKTLPRARQRTTELLAELGRLTGGTWRAAFDDCPQGATQHVGLLWNESRVQMTALRTETTLNPHGEPCKDALRPGFAGLARFADGSRVHVVSVHFKSGGERRSLDLRNTSLDALGRVVAAARAVDPAAEVVFAGDFNTMGCPRCSPKVAAEEERTKAGDRVARDGLRWLPNDPPCTEYYRAAGHLLDGFVVTSELADRVRTPAQADGLCGAWSCRSTPGAGRAAAFRRLSDHCPVVMELFRE